MENVLGDKQRARTASEKDRRRDSIVQSAMKLFTQTPGSLPTMSAIAAEAGVSKGTAYIYFDTKESIYLAVLEDSLHEWLEHIEHYLPRAQTDAEDAVVSALTDFAHSESHLWPLASLSHGVIEANIDSKALLSYKTKLAQKFKRAAKAIRQHLKLDDKDAEHVETMLMQSYAFILGQWQVCHPPASISKLLAGPSFKILQPDFTQSIERGLHQQWHHFIEQQRKQEGGSVFGRLFGRRQ